MRKILFVSGIAAGMFLMAGCNSNTPQSVSINSTSDQEQVAAACSPYFSKQPVNAKVLCGSNNWVNFSATATGATISYQWYYNYDGSSNRSLCNNKYFTGVTTPNLSCAPQTTTYLWCQARASCGTVIWSNRVVMTVGPVTITRQPSDLTDPCGVANWMTFSTAVSGATNYYYEWYWSSNSNGPWYSCINDKYFTGGDTPNLKAYPVDTRYLYCSIMGACGQSITTRVAKFNVCWQ